ncbi:MAG: hypothetical protein KF709_10535 [Gemmatimonadaceae bacterium]|nr:hypothetical protein [Gemmatimonadaceae bacterium]
MTPAHREVLLDDSAAALRMVIAQLKEFAPTPRRDTNDLAEAAARGRRRDA